MKAFIKQNLTLVLAFSLPVILIVFVALSTYLPSLLLSTNYNFVYATCSNDNYYNCSDYLEQRYEVVEGKLTIKDVDPTIDSDGDKIPDVKENYTTRLFLHDTKNNESREISPAEAQGLTLNNLLTSPDGVSVSSDYNRGPDFLFVFDGGSSYGYYLMKGDSKVKLNLINSNENYYYQHNFQFIGWVTPGRN